MLYYPFIILLWIIAPLVIIGLMKLDDENVEVTRGMLLIILVLSVIPILNVLLTLLGSIALLVFQLIKLYSSNWFNKPIPKFSISKIIDKFRKKP